MKFVRFLYMNRLCDRVSEILADMEGPDRGKQTRLAKLAGCTRGLVNQWLQDNERLTMGYEYAKNIEDRLGYRIDWILTGKAPKFVSDADPKTSPPRGITPTAFRVAIEFDRMEPEQKKMILRSMGIPLVGANTDANIADEGDSDDENNEQTG